MTFNQGLHPHAAKDTVACCQISLLAEGVERPNDRGRVRKLTAWLRSTTK